MLYELLTGRTPLDTADLLKMGVEELKRTVREREPLNPSARLRTLGNQELTKTARTRRIRCVDSLVPCQADGQHAKTF